MNISFEVYERTSPGIEYVQDFWMREWDRVMKKLTGKEVNAQMFDEYDFHYVLRFNGKLGGIMSSAWQYKNQNFKKDSYYSALDNPAEYIDQTGFTNFHKMGMIAADLTVVPTDFRLTRVIIGCGMKYTKAYLQNCEGVVSFPRPDTSVYKACVDWRAYSLKTDLTMYNVPVNFIVLKHSDLKTRHNDIQINDTVEKLWKDREIIGQTLLSA